MPRLVGGSYIDYAPYGSTQSGYIAVDHDFETNTHVAVGYSNDPFTNVNNRLAIQSLNSYYIDN